MNSAHNIDALKINGRTIFVDHLSNFRKTGNGEYKVCRHGVEYTIFGGRKCGGGRNEWFVEQREHFSRPINCTSLVDAIKMIDRM